MKKEKKKPLSFLDKLKIVKQACISVLDDVRTQNETLPDDPIDDISLRVRKILNIAEKTEKKPTDMTYLVMYDIENNKIRTHIAKYLKKQGCVRIQKSIFMGDTDRKIYHSICQTLKEVQEIYDNHDSILLVPISTDEIKAMKIIGKQINIEIIANNPNTLFF